MAEARTIAPDRRRLAEAARAGVRRRPRWLARGLLCLLLAALFGRGPALAELVRGDLVGGDLEALAADARALWLALLALAALAVVAATAAAGVLGAAQAGRRPALAALRERPTPGLLALAGLLVALALVVHRGVIAGAARAADAGPAALMSLWTGWLELGLTAGGALLIAGGLAELGLDELGRRRALYRSPRELRDEARTSGRGRG